MTQNDDIHRIYKQWHETVRNRDLDGTLSLYADNAILETPLAMAVLEKTNGILMGKSEIKLFLEAGIRVFQNSQAQWYRIGAFFSNGKQLIWEYPRETQQGEQVDLIEMMDISEGLIVNHRVYWGWYGVNMLMKLVSKKADA